MSFDIGDAITVLPKVIPIWPQIKAAIDEFDQIATDPAVIAAIATAEKVMADPKLKQAIATFEKLVAIVKSAQSAESDQSAQDTAAAKDQ